MGKPRRAIFGGLKVGAPTLFPASCVYRVKPTDEYRMTRIQQFKTTINCGSCVRTVTPFLDDIEGVTIWRVDVDDDRKVLTVEGTAERDAIVAMVEEAGFEIAPLV